jgi:hypothetical protein
MRETGKVTVLALLLVSLQRFRNLTVWRNLPRWMLWRRPWPQNFLGSL